MHCRVVLRNARISASMKAPPKRKGNTAGCPSVTQPAEHLNESPSEKEGKFAFILFKPTVAIFPQ